MWVCWDRKSWHCISDATQGIRDGFNWLPPPMKMKMSGADASSRYLSCQVCWFHIRTHTFTAQQSDRHKAEPEDPGDGLLMADSQTWPIWTGDDVYSGIKAKITDCSFRNHYRVI